MYNPDESTPSLARPEHWDPCDYPFTGRGFVNQGSTPGFHLNLGYCPGTVTVYNSTMKGVIYPYYEYYSTVTEWGQYPTYGVGGCSNSQQV